MTTFSIYLRQAALFGLACFFVSKQLNGATGFFANGVLVYSRLLSCEKEFYDFVAISLCGGKDYFLEKTICSKDYRLKEQTRLAIYERGYPRKFIKEVTPVKRRSNSPRSFRPATLFLKGRQSPAFSLTPRTIYHCAMMGKRKQAI